MLEICPIKSIEDPRLAPYRTMRRQYDHFKEEVFIAEGDKVVQRLLESSIEIISLLMPQSELGQFEKLCRERNETITAFTAPKSVLEILTGFQLYRGILALAKVPRSFSLAEIIKGSVPPLLLVAIDGVTNAENLGTMVRNAVAFGAHGLLLSHTSAPAYLRRSVRGSMGVIFKLRHLQTDHLAQTLRDVTSAGINVIAAHPHSDSYFSSVDLTVPTCVVFGSEGDGVSLDVLNACNKRIAIPMRNGTDSLNVASASAAFLYEVQRQRTGQ